MVSAKSISQLALWKLLLTPSPIFLKIGSMMENAIPKVAFGVDPAIPPTRILAAHCIV